MNFIRHIRLALELLANRADATPHHVSLYMALFSQWNDERFPESVMLVRAEVMQAAHIGSASTYLNRTYALTGSSAGMVGFCRRWRRYGAHCCW